MSIDLLLIDDELTVLRTLSAYFTDYDIEVATATNAKEALEIVHTHSPKVCIIDENLPDAKGSELAHTIKSEFPHTRIYIHTGSIEYKLPDNLLNLGFTKEQILEKPFGRLSKLLELLKPYF